MIKKNAEGIIIKVLRVGVIVSSLLILLGMILLYANGEDITRSFNVTSLSEIIKGSVSFDSCSIIMLGLLMLIITPVLRVVASMFVFISEKDFLYFRITIIVLIILLISFLIGIYM